MKINQCEKTGNVFESMERAQVTPLSRPLQTQTVIYIFGWRLSSVVTAPYKHAATPRHWCSFLWNKRKSHSIDPFQLLPFQLQLPDSNLYPDPLQLFGMESVSSSYPDQDRSEWSDESESCVWVIRAWSSWSSTYKERGFLTLVQSLGTQNAKVQ